MFSSDCCLANYCFFLFPLFFIKQFNIFLHAIIHLLLNYVLLLFAINMIYLPNKFYSKFDSLFVIFIAILSQILYCFFLIIFNTILFQIFTHFFLFPHCVLHISYFDLYLNIFNYPLYLYIIKFYNALIIYN